MDMVECSKVEGESLNNVLGVRMDMMCSKDPKYPSLGSYVPRAKNSCGVVEEIILAMVV